jgi:N-methylhydantoinase A
MHVSTDIGGTFTDFVILAEGRFSSFKLPSTPHEPGLAVRQGIERAVSKGPEVLSHGTTVGTNAVLERKGARCALVTTKGFRDVLVIGRQVRPSLYNLFRTRPDPYISHELCFEVDERVTAQGEILKGPSEQELSRLRDMLFGHEIEAVAVSLLFSYIRPEHERMVAQALNDWPVSISSDVLPQFREYERTSTTVLDAYVKPILTRYITQLETFLGSYFYIMQSNGGVTTSTNAKKRPVSTLLSGPAGGVAAAQVIGELSGIRNLISLDMGGTSTDISLIVDSQPLWTSEGSINSIPLSVPVIDINTIGAGGGSLVWLDRGGALRVGPQSAGADPGPACYDRGGDVLTVTDCNLLTGFLGQSLLDGEMPLALKPAARLVGKLAETISLSPEKTASSVLDVVNANMMEAIKLTLARRGLDPTDFTLVAYGGAGPVHACTLAAELGISNVVIPFMPGAFSAYGILVSDIRLSYSRTHVSPLEDSEGTIRAVLREMREAAEADLERHNVQSDLALFIPSLDLRYRGQSHETNVELRPDMVNAFHKKHESIYGHSISTEPVELVNIRLFAVGKRDRPCHTQDHRGSCEPKDERDVLFWDSRYNTKVLDRGRMPPGFSGTGPAIVEEGTATTVIPPDVEFSMDENGIIHLEVR